MLVPAADTTLTVPYPGRRIDEYRLAGIDIPRQWRVRWRRLLTQRRLEIWRTVLYKEVQNIPRQNLLIGIRRGTDLDGKIILYCAFTFRTALTPLPITWRQHYRRRETIITFAAALHGMAYRYRAG